MNTLLRIPGATRGSQAGWGLLVLLGMSVVVVVACRRSEGPVSDARRGHRDSGQVATPVVLRGAAFGTTWAVTWTDRLTAADRKSLLRRIDQLFDTFDREFSHWRDDSVVARMERQPAHEPFPISERMAHVLREAAWLHDASDGALDVTIAPLVELWGFGPAGGRALPTDDQILHAKRHVGMSHVQLIESETTGYALVKHHDGVRLDLSSLAKGYAIDVLAAWFDERGVRDYLIELGGELRGRGQAPPGRAWHVGLEWPSTVVLGELRGTVRLENAAIATSGTYRNYWRAGSLERPSHLDRASAEEPLSYAHVIDPRSGRPVDHELVAVTVVAETALRADGWATALLVVGPEKAFALAEQYGLAARLVVHGSEGGQQQMTPEFRALLATPGE